MRATSSWRRELRTRGGGEINCVTSALEVEFSTSPGPWGPFRPWLMETVIPIEGYLLNWKL